MAARWSVVGIASCYGSDEVDLSAVPDKSDPTAMIAAETALALDLKQQVMMPTAAAAAAAAAGYLRLIHLLCLLGRVGRPKIRLALKVTEHTE